MVGKATTGKPQKGAQWGGNIAGDPGFTKPGDFRIPAGNAAIDAGAPIPSDWPDPLGTQEKGRPDAGAIPSGGGRLSVGRGGRLEF